MVDHATFLLWLAQQVPAVNLAQLGFVAKIAEEYLEGLLQHRGFLRPFIEGCTVKITEVSTVTE
jgi:mediator of RNA polymerase II transcription subunit 12, fungi type